MCRRDISIYSPPSWWDDDCASEETGKPLLRHPQPCCGTAGRELSVPRAAAPGAPAGLGKLLRAEPCRAMDAGAGHAGVSGWLPEPTGFPGYLMQGV